MDIDLHGRKAAMLKMMISIKDFLVVTTIVFEIKCLNIASKLDHITALKHHCYSQRVITCIYSHFEK